MNRDDKLIRHRKNAHNDATEQHGFTIFSSHCGNKLLWENNSCRNKELE